MPKRTTLTFTSEDAPKTTEGQLFVYYCKYSGKHAFTLDGDLGKMPKRRTDGSRIVDTQNHHVKLYTSDGGVKLIKRKDGKIERQHRLNVGKLPVAYKSSEDGQYLYVLDNAVSTYVNPGGIGDKMLVPPCIVRNAAGATQVRVDIEDRAHRPALVRISADSVRIHITINVAQEGSNEEILNLFSKILNVRLSQLQLARPAKPGSSRKRILIVDHLSPQEVFDKMQAALVVENTRRNRAND
mmetsp:Transcript_23431/g.51441  ORF Transcript_23431/g.51441 Transcript_23431/m.51441 type:complete len:241 (-) Transcript_23431:392-1114(-)|eukprot:CAMPEP_0202893446 /NCGR_PEP_ID=MMETSP1392-20130828/3030_1 /ASSEMBLY_ACC=CAM_ASM_000868 /TAXON_ID=225041 /ORGANISM="Chlamydomonas chlamydogama, Strain SAG 11-48b" /LENGTH=240 /DNA_ID=CAMNT_0049577783 /DNA_START=139 /DNA_END=861 /DNA_ORIENTATION=-